MNKDEKDKLEYIDQFIHVIVNMLLHNDRLQNADVVTIIINAVGNIFYNIRKENRDILEISNLVQGLIKEWFEIKEAERFSK